MAIDVRRCRLAAAAAGALIAIGCAGPVRVPVQPPSGLVFAQFSAPLETQFEATPLAAKVGTAQVQFLREPFFTNLPIITWGDASLEAAAADAGIQKIHYSDYELLNVLGIYVQFTVRVYGE